MKTIEMKTIEINTQEEFEGYRNDKLKKYDFSLFSAELNCSIFCKVGYSLKVGGSLKAKYIFSFVFDIKCKKIKTTILPFYRNYWAEMPPLKKWHGAILDESNCWDDFKGMVTMEEAEEICSWDGWHWILRIQLEMFFGLIDEYEVI